MVGVKYDLEVYGEICCEECNDIIHNHFDCPICGKQDAPTDNYIELESDDILTCQLCNAEFKLASSSWYFGAVAVCINDGDCVR